MPFISRAQNIIFPREFILCLDYSISMYAQTGHYQFQRDGHAAAIRDPEVAARLLEPLTYVRVWLWAGEGEEREIHAAVLHGPEDIERLARAIETGVPRRYSQNGLTLHSSVLRRVLASPIKGEDRIVDISTDDPISTDYEKRACSDARRQLWGMGTRVNVFVVGGMGHRASTLVHFVQTPGGITEHVFTWEDCAEGIKKKMRRELV